ncbi:histidine kinase [Paenibacillus sp. FSL A5-0031]|uniref:sensor histidine kinase n=1 Tax=Paenibacillus sp. FSL A5-0031 TaxID=1920420 RepID=UPI0009700527|nr:sensor histidine kinase [Paenibacillus sp. FSL A5-0031]OME88203.1 histidine kinase [Paenibacillus sp. FSL A5-0031]
MLFYFVALFTAAVIVILNNRRSESNRWAALFLFSASIGGLSEVLIDIGLFIITDLLQFFNYTFTPYAVFVFCLLYASVLDHNRMRKKLKFYLSIPIFLMALFVMISSDVQWFFNLLLLWSAPYYLISCYLLVASFWKERDPKIKRSRFITTIIMVPTLLAVLIFIYVAKVITPDFEFFNYISVFMIYSLSVALLCTFMYGVLGVKLRFEHDPMESTMRAVSTGTTMLNHTIKNEIGKIAISTENLRNLLPESNEQSMQQMQIITNASNHMLEMISRIHSQIKDITLKEQPVQLDQLIEKVLFQHEGLMQNKGISLTAKYELRPVIQCDPIHISEAFGNLLMNASDAMPNGGAIEVRLAAYKKGAELSVQDSGMGISEEKLSQVFDPFYSSGKSGRNFGLGLSYVYNVMQKSGAKVILTSQEGVGTRAALIWPRKKILK